ncbi:preprotein translocase subunit YajC [Streptomyces sp. NPDC002004]
MSLVTLLPFIVLIGAMFLMTRSAKKKQQQAVAMRDHLQPGTGVRTIGGLYATVKEVNDETVLLDAAPGVHLIFAKNAIGAVLDDAEYNRIVHGIEGDLDTDTPVVPDDVSSLTGADEPAEATDDSRIDLGKKDAAAEKTEAEGTEAADDTKAADAETEAAEPKKTDGESDAK